MKVNRSGIQRALRWIFFLSAIIFILILSIRKLSDPDLGFHLFYGQWITNNLSVPTHDLTTYSVGSNEYTDLHWLFQVLLYNVYAILGYNGLSILVASLFLILLLITWTRNQLSGISGILNICLLLLASILLESRVLPRPEMITYIFLGVNLIILDFYYEKNKNYLLLLPFIQLVWCNMHGLFVLGLITMGVYFISLWVRDHRPDLRFLGIFSVSILACLINPYFLKGFTFPLVLLSRFSSSNIYHQHIAEFRSFAMIRDFSPEQLLFLVYAGFSILFSFLTFRKRRLHEWLLMIIMLFLALSAVRNMPLFIIISIPVFASSLVTVIQRLKNKEVLTIRRIASLRIIVFLSFTLLSVFGSTKVFSGSYYAANKLNFRFGAGIDPSQLPEELSTFLIKNRCKGKILNSLGTGGWLSWRLPQPVYIDGRLEVMQEDIYEELTLSWNNGLLDLTAKYQPDLIIYNYLKYFPWTEQLKSMPDWRIIYLDGLFVVYAREGYSDALNSLSEKNIIHRIDDYSEDITAMGNIGMFCLQSGRYQAAQAFISVALDNNHQHREMLRSALSQAEIMVKKSQSDSTAKPDDKDNPVSRGAASNHAEAVQFFNDGNRLYKEGNLQRALDAYTQAIKTDPSYARAYNNRGNTLAIQKKYREAIEDFNSSIAIDPLNPDAYLGKGSSLFYLGDINAARTEWEKAKKLGNQQAENLIRLSYSK